MYGVPLLEFESLDSTNRYALEWHDAPHGAAVVARSQTQGRGRLGRKWASPPEKGLYLSVVLHRGGVSVSRWSLASALAVAQAVEAAAEIKIKLKWPNDILALDATHQLRKIGGILCEARGGGGPRIVVGIGLNLNHEAADFPERLQFPASSLQILTGKRWENAELLAPLLDALERVDQRLEGGEWDAVLSEINSRCCGMGEVVKISGAGEVVFGVLELIDHEGRLVIRTAEGPRAILAGDVSYL